MEGRLPSTLVYSLSITTASKELELAAGQDGRFIFAPSSIPLDGENCSKSSAQTAHHSLPADSFPDTSPWLPTVLPYLTACLFSLRTGPPRFHPPYYLVSYTNGRQHLVGAVMDPPTNDTQCSDVPAAMRLAVTAYDLSPSALANFPYTFTWSDGENGINSVTMHQGRQIYHLQHRNRDGAAILVPVVNYKVIDSEVSEDL